MSPAAAALAASAEAISVILEVLDSSVGVVVVAGVVDPYSLRLNSPNNLLPSAPIPKIAAIASSPIVEIAVPSSNLNRPESIVVFGVPCGPSLKVLRTLSKTKLD